MEQRRITVHDLEHAVWRANEIQPYSGGFHDDETSSSWRVTGPTLEGRRLSVGVQLTRKHTGEIVVVVTVFVERRRRGA
jgi:hypothetical protein